MPKRTISAIVAVATSLVVAAVVTVAPSSVGAVVPPPSQDPFYSQPANLASDVPGQILAVRRITAITYILPVPADAWQIKYRSADQNGTPTANVTTLIVPTTPWKGSGARPLESHQVAEDSAGIDCAPSYGFSDGILSGQASLETGLVYPALIQGWAVVFPDYQGPDSQFLAGRAEAQGVLDSLIAVRNFAPAGLQNSPIGLDGYSGGGIATTWAAQYQHVYAPDLPIKGYAIGGVVADYQPMIKDFLNLGLTGVVMMGTAAVSRAFPQENIPQYFNAKGKAVLASVANDCTVAAQLKYPVMSMNSLTTVPDVFDYPPVARFLHSISPLGVADNPIAPVFMWHGTLDELAPDGPARALYQKFCNAGVRADDVEIPLAEHALAALAYPLAWQYLADRFAGKPAPTSC